MQFEVVETFSAREGQSCRNIPMCNSQRCSTEASLSQTKAQRMSTIEKVKTRIPFWETLRLSSDWEEQNGKLSLVGWSCRSRSRPSGASDELGSAKLNSANCHLLALPRVHQQCWTNIPSTDVHQSLDKMQDALQINQCWNWTISQNIFQGLILEKLKCTLQCGLKWILCVKISTLMHLV